MIRTKLKPLSWQYGKMLKSYGILKRMAITLPRSCQGDGQEYYNGANVRTRNKSKRMPN